MKKNCDAKLVCNRWTNDGTGPVGTVTLLLGGQPFHSKKLKFYDGPSREKFIKECEETLKPHLTPDKIRTLNFRKELARLLKSKQAEEKKAGAEPVPKVKAPTTEELINSIAGLFDRYFYFVDPGTSMLIALWIVGTYQYRVFECFGYLWFQSHVKRCGKSNALRLLSKLCYNATEPVVNPTEAVIFRTAHDGRTQIFDEVETLTPRDAKKNAASLVTLLNAGFQKDAVVSRYHMDPTTNKQEREDFNAYSPKVLASINPLATTIADRAFYIPMVSKPKTVHREKLRLRKVTAELRELSAKAKAWVGVHGPRVEAAYHKLEELPDLNLDDRLEDIAAPLYALAQHSGSPAILEALSGYLERLNTYRRESDLEASQHVVILVEVMEKLLQGQKQCFVPSTRFRDELKVNELDIHSTAHLANFLKPFHLKPTRNPDRTQRGYYLSDTLIECIRRDYALEPSADPHNPSKASEVSVDENMSVTMGVSRTDSRTPKVPLDTLNQIEGSNSGHVLPNPVPDNSKVSGSGLTGDDSGVPAWAYEPIDKAALEAIEEDLRDAGDWPEDDD